MKGASGRVWVADPCHPRGGGHLGSVTGRRLSHPSTVGTLIYCPCPFNGLLRARAASPSPAGAAPCGGAGKIYYRRVINLGLPPRALGALCLMGCFLSSGAMPLASLDQLCLIIKIFDAEN